MHGNKDTRQTAAVKTRAFHAMNQNCLKQKPAHHRQMTQKAPQDRCAATGDTVWSLYTTHRLRVKPGLSNIWPSHSIKHSLKPQCTSVHCIQYIILPTDCLMYMKKRNQSAKCLNTLYVLSENWSCYPEIHEQFLKHLFLQWVIHLCNADWPINY